MADPLSYLPSGWRPAPRQRRQADEVNAAWVRRYLAARAQSTDAAM